MKKKSKRNLKRNFGKTQMDIFHKVEKNVGFRHRTERHYSYISQTFGARVPLEVGT